MSKARLVTRAAVPLLREGAGIVNVASDTALWGAPRLMAYVASRGRHCHDPINGARTG